ARDRGHRTHGGVGAAGARSGGAPPAGRLLPGRRGRRRRRRLAPARAAAARPRPRDDRAAGRGGLLAERLRRRRAVRRRGLGAGPRLRQPQPHRLPDRREPARLAGGPADEARGGRRPARARPARAAAEGALRRTRVHLEVAAALPRVRTRRRDEGGRPRLPRAPARLHEGADDRLRRRRERRRARRVAVLRHRRRQRARAREGGRELDLPLRRRRGGRAGARGAPTLHRMIDLRAARADADRYRAALARKGAAEAFDELLAADERKRALQTEVEELRARTKLKGKPTPEQLAELTDVKERLQPLERQLAEAEAALQSLLDRVPNPPADDTPDGAAEEDAVTVREVGEPPAFPFEPRDHLDLSAAHGWIDVERGAKVSGSRFVYRVGDAALLELALYRWALSRLVAKGHVPVLPPVLVRDEAMYGTGFFPSDKGDYYETPEDGLFLVGTSEVPAAAFHGGEILDALPRRYVAFSTCFRREAGAAGKDTRGMFRVHQFDKVEMFVYCEPERSAEEHERLLALEEELVQELGLPYRVLNIA